MKEYLKSDLQGKDLVKPYLLFFIPFLVVTAISGGVNEKIPSLSPLFSLLETFIMSLLYFNIIKFIISGFSYKEQGLSFNGTIKELAPKMLKWIFLNFITLGIYSPWYCKHYLNFYLNKTSYNENKVEFLSEPKVLLKRMLLFLYLPLLVLISIFALFMYKRMDFFNIYQEELIVPIFIFIFGCILICLPFVFFFYYWLINFKYKENFIFFNRTFIETIKFFITQIFLTIITLGIYYPAMLIKFYRFFVEGSIIADEERKEKGNFEFSGHVGFGFLWGQILLSIITVGIYGPWAISKIANRFLNNTCIEIKN